MSNNWEVFAVKYADRNARTRRESFIFDETHDSPHPMDYFIWLLRNGDQTIVVDTGYDAAEGKRRSRPVLREPAAALLELGVRAEEVDTLIITHLHYDHAGTVPSFPNATIYLQTSEMAYATGPCMCHDTLQMPFTADHVCDMVRRVYDGKVRYLDGDGEVADGVTLHRIGGHSRGLQAVRVRTSAGWLCLASDAAHYYENVFSRKPFPIVVDLEEMLAGFDRLNELASEPNLIVPGHDPLIARHFPVHNGADFIFRLDQGPLTPVV